MSLTQFNFNTQEIRVITVDGAPWFVAKDLCDAIGLVNVGQALARLEDDEKDDIIFNDVTDRKQEMSIVSESGMYAIMLRSNKPTAKVFRKWITSEVLPSIRRTGNYITPTTLTLSATPVTSTESVVPRIVPTQAIALCKTLLLEAGIEPPIASSWILTQYAKYDPSNTAVYEDSKKLLAASSDIPEPLLSPTEIGKLLADREGLLKPLSAIAINKLLTDRGLQIQAITGNKKTWQITEIGKPYGKVITDTARGHGKTVFHLRWLTKTADLLAAI